MVTQQLDQREQLERLADLDRQAAQFEAVASARDRAEALRVDIMREAHEYQVSQRLTAATEAGRQAVEVAKADLQSWRGEFAAWVQTGFNLAKRLAEIEAPLTKAMFAVIGAVRAAQPTPQNAEESAMTTLRISNEARSIFREIGAMDAALRPWPEPGNPWASTMITTTETAAGQLGGIYDPHGGPEQFLRTRGAF